MRDKDYNQFSKGCASRIACGFSCRKHGNMSLSYGNEAGVLNNRRDFLDGLGIDYRGLVCAQQEHGNNLEYVSEKNKGSGAFTYTTGITHTDGFVTDVKGLGLAIFTADCLSVFLYDPHKPAIGLVHAGWRSTKGNIVGRAIELMRDKFKTRPAELRAGFGPCIRNCCYKVSGEFKEYFSVGLEERAGQLYLDLAAINKRQLLDSGARQENIFDPGLCTSCNHADFFSWRKEGPASGRIISVIALK